MKWTGCGPSRAVQRKRAAVGRLLREFELPDLETRHPEEKLIVSDTFVESLLAASDEAAMRRLVEERSRLVHALRRNGAGGSRLQADLAGPEPRLRRRAAGYEAFRGGDYRLEAELAGRKAFRRGDYVRKRTGERVGTPVAAFPASTLISSGFQVTNS